MTKLNCASIVLWGFLLWLFGYVLGIIFFMIVPQEMIGWFVMPAGIVATWIVLSGKFKRLKYNEYLMIGLTWSILAIALDYLFIVKLLKPADGYYKPDVYLYYLLTFVMPIVYGNIFSKKR